ncbi:MAG: ABC transporter permease [Anaerolineae bacterium]|nr:ABC transporter permease [Anaerolineae bacterium]
MKPVRWRTILPLLALGAIIVVSLLAPLIAPHDPLQTYSGEELRPPSARFPLGSDLLGRDVWSRVQYGGRLTLTVAVTALLIAVVPGLVVGTAAGYCGGKVDQLLSALIDALLAFPGLLLALSIVAIIGNGPLQVACAVGFAGMPAYARIVRSAVLAVKSRPFVEAAWAVGATPRRILLAHLLPNMFPTLVAFATVILSWAIVSAAALNFLGFGGELAAPEWGTMLAEGRQAFRVAPWAALAPGAAIMITLLAVNLCADSLTHTGSD